jgi:cytochrome c oxidase assembly protein subunit 11
MDTKELARRNRRVMICALIFVCVMISVCFAAVPLYRVFCNATGLAGTTRRGTAAVHTAAANARTITIRFDSSVDGALPWDFRPEQQTLDLKIGQTGFTSFTAHNLSGQPTRGIAVYNVSPYKVGKYFTKTQCFCFSDQPLEPHQTAHLPVVFYVDPKFQADENMQDVQEITLSYRFYPAGSRSLDAATKKFQNAPAE